MITEKEVDLIVRAILHSQTCEQSSGAPDHSYIKELNDLYAKLRQKSVGEVIVSTPDKQEKK